MSKIFKSDYIDYLQLPRDVVLGETVIELSGNTIFAIENYDKIINFMDNNVIIKAKNNYISITGHNLIIDNYSKNELHIRGKIDEIKFEQ